MLILRSIKKIGEKIMKKLFIIIIVIIAVNYGANLLKEWHAGYELQQINKIEVTRCAEYLQQNPDGVCD